MAKSYTLEEAVAPVISIIPQAGGSLVEGTTYSVCVCGTFGISTYYNLGYGRQISAPSNTVNFTATAVDKSFEITIDTPSTGVTAIQFYIVYFYADTDSDPDFYSTTDAGVAKTNVWGRTNSGNQHCYYAQPVANFPLTIDEDDRAATYSTVPYFHQGQPELRFSGGTWADPITPKNIYDYLVGLGGGEEKYMDKVGDVTKIGIKRCMGYTFFLQLYSTGATYFKVPDREICIFAVPQSLWAMERFYTGNMAADGVSHTGDYPVGGGTIYFLGRSSRYNSLRNFVVYNGVTSNAPASVYAGFWGRHLSSAYIYVASGQLAIEDSNHYAYVSSCVGMVATSKLKRLNVDLNFALGFYPGAVFDDLKVYYRIASMYYYQYTDLTLTRIEQVANSYPYDLVYILYPVAGYNRILRLYDNKFFRGDLVPSQVYWYCKAWVASHAGITQTIISGFRLNVHVEEADGTVVNGATVVLTDAYGVNTIDTTTDINGDIVRTNIGKWSSVITIPDNAGDYPAQSYKTWQYMIDNYPNITEYKLHTPFILTISKAGKGVYKAVLDRLSQADWYPSGINLRVTLPRAGFETKLIDTTIHDSTIY